MLDAGVLTGLIDGNLAADGARGPRRTRFSGCVARGVVKHFVGKPFNTNDTGNGKGGTGIGIGIKALSAGNMTDIAYNVMDRHGPKARSFLSAIMRAIEQHLREATMLSTTNPQVGKGVGIVIVGSIGCVQPELQALIEAELIADGARGPKRNNIAKAISTGVVTDVKGAGTGTVTISGPVIPPGTSGIGIGTIS
jgi:hypothetical protein